jgi:GcrA cell cycle regulator
MALNDPWHDPEQGSAMQDHLAFLLCTEGRSFGLIAERLGVSRSAAIGKAYRLKLGQPKQKITMHDVNKSLRRTKERIPKPKPVPVTKPPSLPPPPAVDPHAYYVPVWQLNNETCRFPMWHETTPVIERLYCGVPEADFNGKRPFCCKHAKLCYRQDRWSC